MKKLIYLALILLGMGIVSSCAKEGGNSGETVGGLKYFTGRWESTEVFSWEASGFPVVVDITKETLTFINGFTDKNTTVKYYIDEKMTEFWRELYREGIKEGATFPFDIENFKYMFFYQGELEFDSLGLAHANQVGVGGVASVLIANYETNLPSLAKCHMDWYSTNAKKLLSFYKY